MKQEKAEVILLDCRILADRELFQALFEKQDEARKEKILRCRARDERLLSLGAGCLLRYGLRRRSADPAALRFTQDGAPCVEAERLYVSVSHSGSYAMLGLAPEPLGVDIEQWQPERMDIADHFFTAEERALIRESTLPVQEFFRIWSRKECMIKRDGLRDLRRLSVLEPENGGVFRDFPLAGYSCVYYGSEKPEPELELLEIMSPDML